MRSNYGWFMRDMNQDDVVDASLGFYVRHAAHLTGKLQRYYRLLLLLVAAALVSAAATLCVIKPSYTAVAIVGPSNGNLGNASSGGGIAGMLGGGLGAGALKRLAGGLVGGGDSKVMFDQYTELLTSNRLAAKLAQDPNVLRAIFYKSYDWDLHQWRRHSAVMGAMIDFAKGLLHYPVKLHPDQDDVAKFLDKEVNVDAPLTSSFVTVSLVAEDPKKSEWLLNTLLRDADSIIREDRRKDVESRIAYLTAALPQVTQTDQRDAIISLLSDQEQSMMTIQADNRYASALVDTPHADLKPTSPSVPNVFVIMMLLALAGWGGLVYFLPEGHWLLKRFTRPWKWRFWTARSGDYADDRV